MVEESMFTFFTLLNVFSSFVGFSGAPIVDAITPVPGGVGSVTTSVLMKHVVEAAEKL